MNIVVAVKRAEFTSYVSYTDETRMKSMFIRRVPPKQCRFNFI